MGRFSTRGEVARRERVEYALVRCTQLSTVVSDPRSTIHGSLSPLCFLKQKKRKNPRNHPRLFRAARISTKKKKTERVVAWFRATLFPTRGRRRRRRRSKKCRAGGKARGKRGGEIRPLPINTRGKWWKSRSFVLLASFFGRWNEGSSRAKVT